MIKKITLLLFILFIGLTYFNTEKANSFSGAAPAGNTGVSGNTCNGCHTGAAANSGTGSVMLSFPGGTEYIPGTTYNLSVTISDATKKRYGFSMVCQIDGTSMPYNAWAATDANTTMNSSGGYDHIAHMNAINYSVSPGFHTYTMDWTAPPSGTGSVTFWISSVAANGASGNSGDLVYLNTTTISEAPPVLAAPVIELKALLEGNFDGSGLTTILSDQGFIPLNQPFSASPWNYGGTESLTSLPANMSDWVLVELWDASFNSVAAQAAILTDSGIVQDVDGNSNLTFSSLTQGNYYVSIRHRNHLDIMSANMLNVTDATPLYDFSTSAGQAMGSLQADLGGVFGMLSGDFDANNVITVDDFNVYLSESSSLNGYFSSDADLDRTVTVSDYNKFSPNSAVIGNPNLNLP